jgi:hypothetical protein
MEALTRAGGRQRQQRQLVAALGDSRFAAAFAEGWACR